MTPFFGEKSLTERLSEHPRHFQSRISLRRLSESLTLFGSAMLDTTFNLVTPCRITVSFWNTEIW